MIWMSDRVRTLSKVQITALLISGLLLICYFTAPYFYARSVLQDLPDTLSYQDIQYDQGLLKIYGLQSQSAPNTNTDTSTASNTNDADISIPAIYAEDTIQRMLIGVTRPFMIIDSAHMNIDLRDRPFQTAADFITRENSEYLANFLGNKWLAEEALIDVYTPLGNIQIETNLQTSGDQRYVLQLYSDQYPGSIAMTAQGHFNTAKNWKIESAISRMRINTDGLEIQRANGMLTAWRSQQQHHYETLLNCGLLKLSDIALYNANINIKIDQARNRTAGSLDVYGSLYAGRYSPVHYSITLGNTQAEAEHFFIEAPNRQAVHDMFVSMIPALLSIAKHQGLYQDGLENDYNILAKHIIRTDKRYRAKREKQIYLRYEIKSLFNNPSAVLKEIQDM